VEVAGLPELVADVALLDRVLVRLERLLREVVLLERLEDRLRGEHPGLDRVVDALQVHGVGEAGRVAREEHAVMVEPRDREVAAAGDRLRAVVLHLRPFEGGPDEGMELELLELAVRVDVGVVEVEIGHVADRDEPVLHEVEPAAAEVLAAERRAHGVPDGAGPIGRRLGELPDLLHAGRVGLRVLPLVQAELRNEVLRDRAARALGEHRHLGHDVRAGLVVALFLAVLVDPLVADLHPDDLPRDPVALVERQRGRHALEDHDALRLDLGLEPAHELGERDDHLPLVAKRRRLDREPRRLAGAAEVIGPVLGHLAGVRDLVDPELVAEQLADGPRVHDRPREAERADLGPLFEHGDLGRECLLALRLGLRIVLLHQAGEVERGREAGRPGPDDHDVEGERVALDVLQVEGRGVADREGCCLGHGGASFAVAGRLMVQRVIAEGYQKCRQG
jgi:hypothetical protein